MDPLAQTLARSPELFPHGLDTRADQVTFVRLGRSDYDAASFLDERILTPRTPRRSVAWANLEEALAAAHLSESCHFIFHIGHAGSTLLSRLIGSHAQAFSLREPGILRIFAQIRSAEPQAGPWEPEGFEHRLSGILKLYSRTFEAGNRSIVKATSFVSEMAAELIARPSQPKALLMFVPAPSYLATILGGANAPLEANALGAMRLARLEHRLGEALPPPSGIGEVVAMSWACEMTGLVKAKTAGGERGLWLDFDAFLRAPHANFARCLLHLALPVLDEFVTAALSGPHMRRYSKAPEHAYDAKLREAVLNQARANFGGEIKRGLSWLDHLAQRHAVVRDAMNL